MKFIPFKNIEDIFFDQSFEEVKKKASIYQKVDIGEKIELDKKYPCIYIGDIDFFIVFSSNGNRIRYVETTNDIYLDDFNLQKEPFKKVLTHFVELDEALFINEEGAIESKKLGFIISKACSQTGNNVLLFSKEYANEDEISPDDIINFYLG